MSIKIGNNFGLANTYSAGKTNNLKFGENKVATPSENNSTNDTYKKIGMVAGGLALAGLAVWGGYKFFHKAEKEVAAATAPATDGLKNLGKQFTVAGEDVAKGTHTNLKVDNDFSEATHGITNKIEEITGTTINPTEIKADKGTFVKGQLATDQHITSTDKAFCKIEPDTKDAKFKVVDEKSAQDMVVKTKLTNDTNKNGLLTIEGQTESQVNYTSKEVKAKLTQKGAEGKLETNDYSIIPQNNDKGVYHISEEDANASAKNKQDFVVAEDHSELNVTRFDSTGQYIPPDIAGKQDAKKSSRGSGCHEKA